MESSYLIHKIIDKYERSSAWKGNSSGNRSIPIQQEDLDLAGKQALLEEARRLENRQLIRVRWINGGSDIERIWYSLEQLPELYRSVGKTMKLQQMETLSDKVGGHRDRAKKPWIKAFYNGLMVSLEQGRVPGILKEQELCFACMDGLDSLTEPAYKRIFSKRYLKNSKVFEQKMQSAVITAARKYCDTVDDNMDRDTILSQIYIEGYSQELSIKGSLVIEMNGILLDQSVYTGGTVLVSETLNYASIAPKQEIRTIITVENKANFKMLPYEAGTLLIFSHGYFSPKERDFLRELHRVLEGQEVEYFHSGDLDYGGVRIFQYIRSRIFPELRPYKMDVETYEQFKNQGEKITKSCLSKLQKMKEPLLQPLIDRICEEKIVIEQESFFS